MESEAIKIEEMEFRESTEISPEKEMQRMSMSAEPPPIEEEKNPELASDTSSEEDSGEDEIPEKKPKLQLMPVVQRKPSGEAKRLELKYNHGFAKAPPKPLSAKEIFEKHFVKNLGSLSKEDKSAIASEEWKNMTEIDQKKWREEAEDGMKAHEVQIESYRKAIQGDLWRTECPKGALQHSEEEHASGKRYARGASSWSPVGLVPKDLVLHYPVAFGYFKCPPCFDGGQIFVSHHTMVSHARQRHGVSLVCSCSRSFHRIKHLKQHMDSGCSSMDIPCKISKKFEKERKLKTPFEFWWTSTKDDFTEANKALTKKELIKMGWNVWKQIDQQEWIDLADTQVPTVQRRRRTAVRRETTSARVSEEEEVLAAERLIHNPD